MREGKMNVYVASAAVIVLFLIIAAFSWRWFDHRADYAERSRLMGLQPSAPAPYDPAMVADLPEPARRYFGFSIAPGTPLFTVADIRMSGQFSLGNAQAPNYLDMSAEQTLAAPHGFVWKMHAANGLMRISGSDSGHWTRFWAMGLLPVARMGGNADHRRSAFGRYVAEAVFWTPAALLPGPGIAWQAVDGTTARVVITHDDLTQEVVITVDDAGRPVTVRFPRWSDANPEKRFRQQPFGGRLSQFRSFSGFTLATHVEAGNHFGTSAYFPFFIADVSDVQFPTQS